jgi:hypothetical protein
LARLRAVRAQAGQADTDTGYWMLAGDLAWQNASRSEAVHAYRTVWASGAAQAQAAERLIEAADADASHAEAISVAREAYRRFDDPRWLLLAMDLASRAQHWDELRDLLEFAGGKSSQVANSAMYWLQSANLARHEGRQADARAAYERALLLNPDSVAARVALLWFEIDNGDRLRLDRLLRAWQGDAPGDAAYWAPFAAGMLRLQRAGDALPWFERQLRDKPDDMASALDYAEALARAGRTGDALRQRRAAYLHLRLHLRPQADARAPIAPALPVALLMPYARLVREFEGEAAAQTVLAGMIGRGDAPEQARELLVASLLAEQKFDSARHWLQRARAGQYKLPAWQYLAVAQADNNRPEIAALLASSAAELSALDRIAALRKLGRNAEALALAEAASLAPEHAGNQALLDAVAQLRRQQSKRGALMAERRQLGSMELRRLELSASAPLAAGRATVRLAQNTLGASAAVRLPGRGTEHDLSGSAQLPFGEGEAVLTLGTSHRPDDSTLYAGLAWSRPLGRGLLLRVDGAVNTVSEETVLLRAIGTKDRLGGALTVDLGNSRYARIDVAAQRYATRADERLGSGYRIEAELGATPFSQGPRLQVRLGGSWEQNRLAARLPAALGGITVPAWASVADAVPEQFGWGGVGSTLSFGDPHAMPGRMHGSIDALLGRQWPDRRAAYSVRAVLGLPLAVGGELRAEAFHSNVQGGAGGARSRGVRFAYERPF